MATLKDFAQSQNIKLGWNDKTKNVTLGDKEYTPDQLRSLGLTLQDNRWQGSAEQLGQLSPKQVQPPQTAVSNTPVLTPEQLAQEIANTKKKQAIAGIQNALGRVEGSLTAEQAGVAPRFAEVRRQIGVGDVMSRTAQEKRLAQGGLSVGGAREQGEIAQNIITGGALGSARQQEQEVLSDIERRRQQAREQAQFQIGQAEAGAELTSLESQLRQVEDRQRQEAERAAMLEERGYQARTQQEEREFQLLRDEASRLSQRDRDILLNEFDRDNSILQAQIQEARDLGNFERQRQLEELKFQNDAKLAAIRSASGGGTAPITPKEVIDFVTESTRGLSGPSAAERFVELDQQGYFDNLLPSEIKSLMNKFGVDETMIEQAENRLQGIAPLSTLYQPGGIVQPVTQQTTAPGLYTPTLIPRPTATTRPLSGGGISPLNTRQ